MARVPSRSPWALRTVAHQASWLLVNFPGLAGLLQRGRARHRAGLAEDLTTAHNGADIARGANAY